MKLGLFSISYAGLWGQTQLSLEDFIRRASQLGFESVMLAAKRPHFSLLEMDERRMESLRELLEHTRLTCDVIAAYTDLSPPNTAEVPYLEWQVDYVRQLARYGAALGAKYVRVFTAYSSSQLTPQQQWNVVVRTLREMADQVAIFQLTLAVQNHHDVALDTDALLELIADVDHPHCRLGFDAWSVVLRGESLRESARKAAPWTVITTNADYVRYRRYSYEPAWVNYRRIEPDWVRAVPFGTGIIAFREFFDGLREGGFDGVASYEMCSPIRGGGSLENLDRYARTYLDWMRSYLGGERATR